MNLGLPTAALLSDELEDRLAQDIDVHNHYYELARIRVMQGRVPEGFAAMGRAIEKGWRCWYFDLDPILEPIRTRPEFGGFGANNFSVTMFSDGNVEYDYGGITAIGPLVGAAEGGGEASTATDMSATGGGAISDSPVEAFDGGSPYDLLNPDNLSFNP